MYNNMKVLDIHGHVSAPRESNLHVLTMLTSNTAFASPLSGGPWPDPPRAIPGRDAFAKAAQLHVDYLDKRNIDRQLLGPRPYLMMGWMQPHLLEACTRYINDLIHLQCELFPDRFVGACQLPQRSDAPDTAHTLPELSRAVDELGFAAVYVSPDPDASRRTPGMDDPYWYPLYAECERRGLPIIVHGTNTKDPRIANVPHNYQLGFVAEQYFATMVLSHSDVFERYPELKVVVCHCGGALDRFMKTDHHLSQRDLSNNLFFDTCAHDIDYLTAAIRQRGVERMCFGTEAPGSGGASRPGTDTTGDDLVPVLAGFDWLSDQDRADILHNNPARVCPALAGF